MTIVLAAGAGRGGKTEARRFLEDFIRSRGIEPRFRMVRGGDQIADATRRALLDGEKLVVAGGGDGTVSAVAAQLVDSDAVLGVLPLGTLNHFAKDLGIPIDLESAARVLMTGAIAQVDIGDVNGRIFVNNSSLGLYPTIVIEREEKRRSGWNKWAALAWASADVFRRLPLLSVRLEAEGNQIVRVTPFVFVGNNEYRFEPPGFGGRSRLDAGRLWLYVAPHRPSRWEMIRLAILAILGRVREDKDFYAAPATEFWIGTGRRRLRVALDGEVVTMPPELHYRVRPRALRVVVPAGEP